MRPASTRTAVAVLTAGASTRLAVVLPDGVEVRVDVPGAEGQDPTPGTPVTVGLAERPVPVAPAEPPG